jgi:hypothetical protein
MSLTELNQNSLSIVYQALADLKPRAANPRTHSKKQVAQIANAIRRFGFTNPVLVDDANGIIAGHGRVEAAKTVGLDKVPTVRLSAMSEAEVRAYVIADNRLAENAGWDRTLLGLELQYLTELEIDFDVAVTGFDLPDIDLLIGELSLVAEGDDPADAIVEVAAGPAISRPGDIWQIGNHRLICGDSTQLETYQRLLGSARAQMVFTDPPIMCRLPGTLAASARSSTESSPWHPARCRRLNSPTFCALYSGTWQHSRLTVRSIFSAWTGAMSRRSWLPALPPMRI